MHSVGLCRTLALLFVTCCLLIATPSNAFADSTVPWMTGTFGGYWPWYTHFATSPDEHWGFNLEVYPTTNVYWWWSCDEWQYYCEHQGIGYFTGGTVVGALEHWDGSNWIVRYSFTGSVAPGGDIEYSEVYLEGQLTSYVYAYYGLTFDGLWENGWRTRGYADGYEFPSESASRFELVTTSVPEPGTLILLGSGLLSATLAVRRRLR